MPARKPVRGPRPAPSSPARGAGRGEDAGVRVRRFLHLELPGWLILAVSVAYSASAGGGQVTTFFQVVTISAALAWLAGGRQSNPALAGLLLGWGAGTMVFFNFLALASIGLFLLPVTLYTVASLALALLARPARATVAAIAAAALAAAVQAAYVLLARGH